MSGSMLGPSDILVNNRDRVPVIMELKPKGDAVLEKDKHLMQIDTLIGRVQCDLSVKNT